MKVLFAVNNENISESITKKYQQDYKEIISVKNVYYFDAIIKELQRDKTYDRIVVSEDLQPFSSNNYDQIDKFIFEKMDNISDEATNQNGNDIPIILICADRREKSEPLLVKLFGIGVYNALLGKDRSITAVCQLLNRPRGKKEAKVYYHIDPDDVDYKVESEGDVSEVEIQNIINHYKRLGKNEDQYVESFEHIASQYTDSQLRLIAKFLPLNVKAVLEANSPKYQEVVAFGMPSRPKENYNNYGGKKNNTKNAKPEITNNTQDLEIIQKNLKNNIITEPVIIPSTGGTVKRVQGISNQKNSTIPQQQEKKEPRVVQIQQPTPIINEAPELPGIADFDEEETKNVEVEAVQPKRRGRPKKVKPEDTAQVDVPVVKKGRGRPRKQSAKTETQSTQEPAILPGLEDETESPVNLFDLDNDEAIAMQNQEQEDDMILPGLDNEFLFAQESDSSNDFKPMAKVTATEKKQPERTTSSLYNNESNNLANNIPTVTNNTNSTGISNAISKDKKVVAFIGTSKNGTSFLVNNTAEVLSQNGINTAILDLTKNKNAYYIYTENDENLRNIAFSCMENLKIGNATGIQVHKNLTVYTTVPGDEHVADDYNNILETLVKNYSLVILDCDFDTNYNYFAKVQEIYLVQSLDILTIQPLTAFLRDLKAKNVLDPEKIRVVLNKMVSLKSVTEKTIIGGIAYYNDPAMSFMTELFNKDTVKYCVIPFEEQTYAKYLDGIINCKISLNGYSRNLMTALNTLADMVYPLVGNNMRGNTYSTTYSPASNFSASMNNTLNKMRNNY